MNLQRSCREVSSLCCKICAISCNHFIERRDTLLCRKGPKNSSKQLGINHEETENSLYDKGLVFFAQKEYIQCIVCMSYATFMFTKKEGKQLDIANTNFISGCYEDELKNTIRSHRF